uniref:Leishmanolysin-like peptidase n=1 Tax=Plectus sambesii TaxID=2011161 RepID=A0A914WQD3_9BILA
MREVSQNVDNKQNRPLVATLIVCSNNPVWSGFKNAFDLFRHEILHALGYGTFNAKQPAPPLHYPWKLSQETQYWKAHFMDFANRATAYAKYHFDCPQLDGVESDEDKIHLDEYIYGNELMTPNVGNGQNYFTSISAKILEETYTRKQWYQVNQQIVNEETQLYWYGKKWGCTFAKKSCAEFIEEKTHYRSNNGLDIPAFPFCNADNLDVATDGRKLELCVTNGTDSRILRTGCYIGRRGYRYGESRLPAASLYDLFGDEIPARASQSTGAEPPRRYCPFVDFVAKEDDSVGEWPANSKIVKC